MALLIEDIIVDKKRREKQMSINWFMKLINEIPYVYSIEYHLEGNGISFGIQCNITWNEKG